MLRTATRTHIRRNSPRATFAVWSFRGMLENIEHAAFIKATTEERALATYDCLRPYLGNDEETLRLIKAHHGAEATARTFNGGLIKGALMLARDKLGALKGFVENVTNDLGPEEGAWTKKENGETTTFRAQRCAYKDFFEARGAEFLLETTCCALDVEVWFRDVDESVGVVELRESMGKGDGQCCIVVGRRGA
jgi:hypothetical protein